MLFIILVVLFSFPRMGQERRMRRYYGSFLLPVNVDRLGTSTDPVATHVVK